MATMWKAGEPTWVMEVNATRLELEGVSSQSLHA
jgi:hypothetical protein